MTPEPTRLWAVVPAAGTGRRMGAGLPKQYLPLGGRTVLEHALAPLLACGDLAGLVLALAADDRIWPTLPLASDPRIRTVIGGAERADSVLHALQALPAAAQDWVLVHDAARPCLDAADLQRLRQAMAADPVGGLLAVPVVDTLKRESDGRSVATVDRRTLWRAQTPQLFRYGLLRQALESARQAGRRVTDEASALEQAGHAPRLIAGADTNIKLTRPDDCILAAQILRSRQAAGEADMYRIGQGYDAHRFQAGDGVTIGGVRIACDRGIEAHSDGDVLLHALCDALLGALALGDIGQHFPDTDPRFKGIDSRQLLAEVMALVRARGWRVVNADATVLAQAPKLATHMPAMRETISGLLGCPADAVGLKATTTERMGAIGREEGLAAQAVVLLTRPALV